MSSTLLIGEDKALNGPDVRGALVFPDSTLNGFAPGGDKIYGSSGRRRAWKEV